MNINIFFILVFIILPLTSVKSNAMDSAKSSIFNQKNISNEKIKYRPPLESDEDFEKYKNESRLKLVKDIGKGTKIFFKVAPHLIGSFMLVRSITSWANKNEYISDGSRSYLDLLGMGILSISVRPTNLMDTLWNLHSPSWRIAQEKDNIVELQKMGVTNEKLEKEGIYTEPPQNKKSKLLNNTYK